ncbi:hypothetical protein [Bailinhaonella thermotolerans]|uniref:Uncharacterized protein n=1 Tax=Bailinhaonella thermotolerans TaxID=1070861 RepID=A0A3A4A3E5_9ACTN|nr:hypothetical protein [Bailinhaonella thermotolerans]RJL22122.1 hypothetical protein D5H75_36665 [Bailinhaonella thermotolerans]
MSGYTHVTIDMRPDRQAHVQVSVYPQQGAVVQYYPGEQASPFLAIDHGDAHVWFGLPKEITGGTVAAVRELAAAAGALLADCERLYAAQSKDKAGQVEAA